MSEAKVNCSRCSKSNRFTVPVHYLEWVCTCGTINWFPHNLLTGELQSQLSKGRSKSALDVQEGGGHYKDLKIQPVEYIHANNLPFIEGCVVKYVSRHRAKNGAQDIKKAIHFLNLLLELEYKEKELTHGNY